MRWVVCVILCVGCGRRSFEVDDASASDSELGTVYNRAFVTSTTHQPLTFGADLAGADAICTARAAAAGLPGRFVPWLSAPGIDARDRLAGARGWIRVDGRPVANRIEDLLAGNILHPIRVDEFGEDIGTVGPYVGTATGDDGVSTFDCSGFTDSDSMLVVGEAWNTTVEWTNNGGLKPCNQSVRLYCFGIDRAEPLAVVPTPGRRAFISSTTVALGTGMMAIDDQCTNEASLAGLSGTYRALIGTSTAAASTRFDLAGPNWTRVDGIPIARSPLAFMNGLLDSPIGLTSLGTPRADLPATGGSPTSPTLDACGDWTVPSQSVTLGFSATTNPDAAFTAVTGITCGTPRPVYCLEQ